MMEENNNIFLAGHDASLYLAGPMHKNIPQHLFRAIHLVRPYLYNRFLNPPPPCKYMYAFIVTVTAIVLFQKIVLNTIAHMY